MSLFCQSTAHPSPFKKPVGYGSNSRPQLVRHKFYAGLRLGKWSKMPSADRSELKEESWILPIKKASQRHTGNHYWILDSLQLLTGFKSKINPCGQARNTMVLVAKRTHFLVRNFVHIQLPLLCNFFLKCFCVVVGVGWGYISPLSPLK